MNISANYTSQENSTDTGIAYYNLPFQDYLIYFRIFWYSVFTLSSATFTFGVVSWILIPKWRLFRNYVFLNMLLSGSICVCLCFTLKVSIQILTYFHLTFNHWLIIATFMLYLDLVKIFYNKIEHRYLKSAVFGWTVPALFHLLKYLTGIRFAYFSAIESLLLFIIYLRVFYALCKPNRDGIGTTKKTVTINVLKSTLCFIVSGFILYFSSLFLFLFRKQQEKDMGPSYVFVAIISAAVAFVNVVFLMNKVNRKLWIDYIKQKQSLRV